jgi:hypothetical protein
LQKAALAAFFMFAGHNSCPLPPLIGYNARQILSLEVPNVADTAIAITAAQQCAI